MYNLECSLNSCIAGSYGLSPCRAFLPGVLTCAHNISHYHEMT